MRRKVRERAEGCLTTVRTTCTSSSQWSVLYTHRMIFACNSCGDCRRLGLVCERSPTLATQRRPPSVPTSTELIRPPPTCFYDGCTPQEQHLLQHYICVVSKSLSVVPDEINSFILLFVPMALQQPAMRNALLGLSATHLKRIHSGYELAAVEHQNKAVNMANSLLKNGDTQSSMEGLATILFLCLQEVSRDFLVRIPVQRC